jgi:DsbC/DsbD-like thiol-disulfide interchange protein
VDLKAKMLIFRKIVTIFAVIASAWAGLACFAQVQDTAKPARSGAKAEAVQYLYPEQVTVPAGKSTPVALHFRVKQGLHINSHEPKEDFLIPTVLSIPDSSGVRLESATYPAGTEFALPVEPGTKLIVYTGEFAIQTKIVAQPGDHMVEARLRYQACDDNACLPPKTITVPINVVGK